MPLDVPGCTRATMIIAVSIFTSSWDVCVGPGMLALAEACPGRGAGGLLLVFCALGVAKAAGSGCRCASAITTRLVRK